MKSNANFCAKCERDCSAPQCLHCVDGSQQLETEEFISSAPVDRPVLKGSEDFDWWFDDAEDSSSPSKTDRRK